VFHQEKESGGETEIHSAKPLSKLFPDREQTNRAQEKAEPDLVGEMMVGEKKGAIRGSTQKRKTEIERRGRTVEKSRERVGYSSRIKWEEKEQEYLLVARKTRIREKLDVDSRREGAEKGLSIYDDPQRSQKETLF